MDLILAEIQEILKKAGELPGLDQLDPDQPLTEQGVDSLDLFNVFLAVEENTGVKIPDERMNEIRSLNDLARFVKETRGQ